MLNLPGLVGDIISFLAEFNWCWVMTFVGYKQPVEF